MKTRSKKFRYTSLSVLFTVAVILAVIVLNVVFSALAVKNNWYADMTESNLFTVSDTTVSLLSDLEGDYQILFCRPLDQVQSSSDSMLIYNCAKEFTDKLDNVKMDYLDVMTYPALAADYKRSTSDTVNSTDVIIKSAKGFKKYTQSDFYVVNSETSTTTAFRGEQRIANALLQVAGEFHPVASFTTGHGEQIPAGFKTLFEDVGYDVKTVDLTKEELDPETMVLVIYAPTFDFYGINEDGITNEIGVIDAYMENYGNLMFFRGAQTPTCPELNEYLEDWGIQMGDGTVKDAASATSTDALNIIATLASDDSLGASVTKDMRSLDSQPITLVKNASPIYELFDSRDGRTVSGVLSTTSSAVSTDAAGKETRGKVDLMTLVRETTTTDNGGALYSYVLACSSADFCDDTYLTKSSYGNRDILYSLMTIFNKDQAAVSIDYKEYDPSTLTISTVQARGWLIGMSVVVPVIFFALGIIVWVRRKRL